jgi:hypothetical protein
MQCACAILPFVACPGLQYFSTLSHKRNDLWKIAIEHTMLVLISYTTSPEISLFIRRNERDVTINAHDSSKGSRYSCQILIKLEFSQQVFEKYSDIKFHENPSSGSGVVPCGRTDGQA